MFRATGKVCQVAGDSLTTVDRAVLVSALAKGVCGVRMCNVSSDLSRVVQGEKVV
jgi:5-enolpyruvylshikimate-3-phosphate synthase